MTVQFTHANGEAATAHTLPTSRGAVPLDPMGGSL